MFQCTPVREKSFSCIGWFQLNFLFLLVEWDLNQSSGTPQIPCKWNLANKISWFTQLWHGIHLFLFYASNLSQITCTEWRTLCTGPVDFVTQNTDRLYLSTIPFNFILNCNNTLKKSAIKNNWISPMVLDTVLKAADLPKTLVLGFQTTQHHILGTIILIFTKISQKLIIT
jgi:hypothetical protein